ncbi:chemotaxis protein CheB [Desulfuromonas thiophila]|uniref:protein-glutamate methylesterase n=1 Tax=Desulfuromonas thiophila TaxID=57664 RepID=A0A1G7AE73_9BACT|nr:chemotaxis protein CheB [Desulfuromonas thiophila]SDE13099.1 CheB methylesterase [Desulfuromonas thiophila]
METCTPHQEKTGPARPPFQCVVIGGSAGALTALNALTAVLAPGFPVPLVCVIHLHPHSHTDTFVRALLAQTSLLVKEADDKEALRPATLYLAPANYHLLIEQDRSLALSVDGKVNHSRPSIDVLFETAALAYRDQLAGILLSGASNDGAAGLRRIHDLGGKTLVQTPDTAEVPYMPQSALAATETDAVLPPVEIGHWLNARLARFFSP